MSIHEATLELTNRIDEANKAANRINQQMKIKTKRLKNIKLMTETILENYKTIIGPDIPVVSLDEVRKIRLELLQACSELDAAMAELKAIADSYAAALRTINILESQVCSLKGVGDGS